MSLTDNGMRSLEGPFTHHVYIGFSPKDKSAVFELRAQLEHRGVICYLRPVTNDVKSSIQEGIRVSQRCLLFLSPDYVEDSWYQFESEVVLEKAERFCRDTLVIMKSGSSVEVPKKLCGFKEIVFDLKKIKDEKANARLADIITTEPNVQLAVLPKQNFGYGAALGYFYGFLRLTLPDFRRRLVEETLKNEPGLLPTTVKKMLIIMPESCFCAVEMKSPGKIEFTDRFVVRIGNRAGNVQRDYKSSLYKLKDHERNREYYFAGEFATPLLTMFETYHFGLCHLTKDQLYAERDAFYFTLKAILSHPDNSECNDQFRLLYWSDPETKEKNRLSLYDFLLPVLRDELALEKLSESKPGKVLSDGHASRTPVPAPTRQFSTFEPVDAPGHNPSRIYEEIEVYPMNGRPRGMCLIINIVNFNKGHQHLTQRRGAERDTEILRNLFEDLQFTVQVHVDVNFSTLEELLLTMHLMDHSKYDAFVCCILTHGKLGVVYTSDGKPVEILSLVDYFSDRQCPTLKGKPKMFFIQACQRGDAEPANAFPSPPLSSDSSARPAIDPDEVQEAMTSEVSLEADAMDAPHFSVVDDSLPVTFRHKSVLVPGFPDFLMSYSTLPGSISYRDTLAGSLYVQELNDCLRKGSEIDRALKQVSSQVKKRLADRGEQEGVSDRFQLPFHLTSGMDRLIFF